MKDCTHIYMNERIRQKNPRKPVIVAQGPAITRESNAFELRVDGVTIGYVVFDKQGLKACETHDVKAFVTVMPYVEVVPVHARRVDDGDNYVVTRPQAASPKEPNTPVEIG